MGEKSLPYRNQYHHSFELGAFLQFVLAALWYVTGNLVFGVLGGLNVIFILFLYPFLLTWLFKFLPSRKPTSLGPHQ
jgi:hypothetical protein